MSSSMANSRVQCSGNFRRLRDALLTQPGLPFADVLPAERIEKVFAEHDNLFAASEVYSTAMVVWAFLGQVLCDGKEASCESAVAQIVVHRTIAGLPAPTADTGDYCRARAKLSEDAVHQLAVEVAGGSEQRAAPWLWKGRHAKLVDGFSGWANATISSSGPVRPDRSGWTKPPTPRFPRNSCCARFVSRSSSRAAGPGN